MSNEPHSVQLRPDPTRAPFTMTIGLNDHGHYVVSITAGGINSAAVVAYLAEAITAIIRTSGAAGPVAGMAALTAESIANMVWSAAEPETLEQIGVGCETCAADIHAELAATTAREEQK